MLELDGLTKHFGELTALDGAGFTVHPGRVVGFLGPNGAGKTTAMRCVFGLVEPDGGEVRWNGRAVTPTDRLRFGYMPEERGLYPRMRLGEQLAYFGRLSGLSRHDAHAAAQRWLDELGLGERARARLEELSHGNQQRVQLAAALLHDPDLAVLDEPFAGLDPIGVESMSVVLRRLAARGAAILFSSHQLDLVEDVCDDVVVIDRGRVVVRGALVELRDKAPYRRLEIAVGGRPWTPPIDGLRPVPGPLGRACFLADRSVPLSAVLDAARRHGDEVTALRYDPPTLTDLFREAVAR